jgi:hypothetical protein
MMIIIVVVSGVLFPASLYELFEQDRQKIADLLWLQHGNNQRIKQEYNMGVEDISKNVNHVNLVNPKLMVIENSQTLSLNQKR